MGFERWVAKWERDCIAVALDRFFGLDTEVRGVQQSSEISVDQDKMERCCDSSIHTSFHACIHFYFSFSTAQNMARAKYVAAPPHRPVNSASPHSALSQS
jgi:hypothetical protein